MGGYIIIIKVGASLIIRPWFVIRRGAKPFVCNACPKLFCF
jgi:hypothetical protein